MAHGSGGLHKWLVLQLTNPVILLGFLLPTSSFPAPEYTSYEVITPRQLVLWGGKAKKNELSYILNVSGKDYVIQLKPRKHDFLVKNLPLFTYSSQGRRIESHPYIPVECYHEGHVDGVANSLVVLKTCSGLTGFLSIRDRNYGIEPFHDSSTFQHLLYLINEPKPCMCGMRAPVAKRQAEELRAERGTRRDPRHPKYIELYIVVDEKLFQFEGANETRMAYLILDIVNLMGVHFRELHTSIVLIGLEIWNTGNPFEVTNEVGLLLNNFNSWRVNGLAKWMKHDTALLLTHQEFEHTLGKSYGNAICRPSYSAGVLSYLQKNPILFSRAMSHELGHHMGLEHDESNCVCGGYKTCVMHSYKAETNKFSNCSIHTFAELVLEGNLDCLNNRPQKIPSIKHCGNGVLDKGEECDCGGTQRCKQNLCCNPDCTLKPRAQCSSGPCCKNCHFLPSGELCRIQINECDLPEYCSGKSEWCPNDVYMQDGTPCSKHDSHCYAKQCWTHNYLCARIFGYGATAAPASCFQSRNSVGDAYGNCGRNWTGSTFVKCQPQDVKCGRVQCTNVRNIPSMPHYAVTPTELSGTSASCWSVAYHGGTDFVDLGMVPDGTPCGPGKLCKNHTCIFRKKAVCDPNKKCNDRGVCNNLNNCHCNSGWAPPNCMFWGSGGSIDGGYPRQNWSTKVVKRTFETVIPLGVLVLAAITFIVPRLWKLPEWCRQFTSSRVGGNLQGSSLDVDKVDSCRVCKVKEGLNSTDSKE
ncbi:disintegrin and metalloproteinase domain-containing protein 21-like [Podarcis raffonei]|uniref:disintegrin and metalloproteinase domain-containing protein 21-like n=1 Tax=Podarcis raffonei TaxID=65483 RepID=UPI0023296E69|nr:disintegrin and metalloproteinase domain-containing protein 21-like [Podarcis raffonei]